MRPWPAAGSAFEGWENQVARPFRRFTARDIRTGPILKRWLLPRNWFRPATQAKALVSRYKKDLTGLKLTDLPEMPKLVLCATDIIFGVSWIFERDRVGDWQAGYLTPAPDWPVAFAVAASSCFPPVFDPLRLPKSANELTPAAYPSGQKRDRLVSKLRLSDGGVYDNLGLEPVWKTHQTVLVSDGGAPFRYEASGTPLGRIERCLSVIGKQAGSLRKRWLISKYVEENLHGTYWGISSATETYSQNKTEGYSKALAKKLISNVRTDLDSFSAAEAAVLENHGYLLVEAAIHSHASDLTKIKDAPLSIPYPDWMDEDRVKKALADSHKRLSLKRLFRRK
jgi:NTE family protein